MAQLRSNRVDPLITIFILTGTLVLWSCNGNDGPPTEPETGSVAGEVLDLDEQGVAGADLTLARTGESTRSTSSGSTGGFQFDDVPTGSWTLAVSPPAGWGLAPGETAERSIQVEANSVAQAAFQLAPQEDGAAVSGVVRHDGWGVAHVEVLLRDPTGAESTVTTGASGSFQLEAAEPGELELQIIPPDYFDMAAGEPALRTLTVEAGGSAEVTVELSPVTAQQTIEIELRGNLVFAPDDLTESPGTRIRWVNVEAMAHTITPEGHDAWTSGNVSNAGDTFEVVLNNPGEFSYYCQPHLGDGMTGRVVIQP